MKFTKLALTIACCSVLFCGCVNKSQVVLKVNDTEITNQQFYDDLNKIKKIQFKDAPKEVIKDDSYPVLVLKDRYINDVIVRTLLSQEFEKRKIQVTDKEIDAKKAQIISQIGSEEQFKTILKQNNISDARFREDMANEVKLTKLADTLTSKVSESDVEKYYKANKAQFVVPKRVQVSHILFDTNPESIKRKIVENDSKVQLSTSDIDKRVKEEIAKKESLAKEIQAKAAKNPKEFASLAKQYSDDEANAKKGGDLGYIVEGQMVKEFSQAAFNQKVGTVSPLVKTQFGYHIIYVRDKAAQGTKEFSEVKADLTQYLQEQKKREALQKFVEGLKNRAKIEYLDESLKPEVLKKQMDEALPKQIELQQKLNTPKSKGKVLDKINKEQAQQAQSKK